VSDIIVRVIKMEPLKKKMVVAPLVIAVMLLSTLAVPVAAKQRNRLVFTLHAKGSSIISWIDTLYNSSGILNFAGTSLAEEIEGYDFPAYTIEIGSVNAAGALRVEWTTNDGSHHKLSLSLFSAEETSGLYGVSKEAFGDDPWGMCGLFEPYPLTYKGWDIHDGVKEKISGTASMLVACQLKAPDYSGNLVDKWWIVWTFLEIDGNLVGVSFTELTIPNWCYGSSPNWQYAYVPAAQDLTVRIRAI
jgi:hypothetical protein